ncbi:MAG: hypothetical protein ACYTBP_06300 [Planctomycetota bacterium]|jgi:hypothetical protein
MKPVKLLNNKKYISNLLVLISVAAGMLILVRLTDFFVSSARAERIITEAAQQGTLETGDTEKYLSKAKEIVGELKKKNLFLPPEVKKNPVKEVKAILGNEAFINGNWRKVGDKIGDAKLIAIEPTHVKVEWNGKTKDYAPFSMKAGPDRPGPPKAAGNVSRRQGRPGDGGRPGRRGRGGRGFGMSPEERQGMRERLRNMTPEQRQAEFQKMRERRNSGEQSGRRPD